MAKYKVKRTTITIEKFNVVAGNMHEAKLYALRRCNVSAKKEKEIIEEVEILEQIE